MRWKRRSKVGNMTRVLCLPLEMEVVAEMWVVNCCKNTQSVVTEIYIYIVGCMPLNECVKRWCLVSLAQRMEAICAEKWMHVEIVFFRWLGCTEGIIGQMWRKKEVWDRTSWRGRKAGVEVGVDNSLSQWQAITNTQTNQPTNQPTNKLNDHSKRTVCECVLQIK